MSPLVLILLILIILLLLGGGWGYRAGWYGPGPHLYGGGVALIVLIVLLVMALTGRI